jgi:hypothetical protein
MKVRRTTPSDVLARSDNGTVIAAILVVEYNPAAKASAVEADTFGSDDETNLLIFSYIRDFCDKRITELTGDLDANQVRGGHDSSI